jgi:DNA-binding response OmpR family regulator
MIALAEDPRIDAERHRIRIGEEWRAVPLYVWLAFERLYERRGHVVRETELDAAVWPASKPGSENITRQLVCSLRRTLAGSGFSVRRWRSIGYELEEEHDHAQH